MNERLTNLLGPSGNLSQRLSDLAGFGAVGSFAGSAAGGRSSAGGTVGGALGGAFAKKLLTDNLENLSKGLGEFAGPLGAVAGGVIGSLLGGAFTKTKVGKVSLTSATEDVTATGNSGSAKAAATGLAGSIQSGLQSIADKLGGAVGAFAVTVGQRHGDYRVTTGSSLKVAKGAKDFNEDAAGASAYAIQLAITQGAVTGLSAAVQTAIKSSPDLNKALAEALRVQDVETLLGGTAAGFEKLFKDFEALGADRVRIARQYGFEVLKIEQRNADDREKIIADTVATRVGSLQGLLQDLLVGNLSEGSAVDRRNALLDKINVAKADADAGKDGAADTLAQLYRDFTTASRDAFGTAGGEYASDRALVTSGAEAIVKAENDRVRATADAAAATVSALTKGNDLASEQVDQGSMLLAKTDQLIQLMEANGSGGGSRVDFSLTARQVTL